MSAVEHIIATWRLVCFVTAADFAALVSKI
jgi:hypothetical protein